MKQSFGYLQNSVFIYKLIKFEGVEYFMNEKIFIISPNNTRPIEVCKEISKISDDIIIANTFITDSDYSEKSLSDEFKYYISNDQLNLDYKNNALLYVITDSIAENSYGIAIDEFYNSNIIPMSIKSFNTINPDLYKGCTIVWADSKYDRMMKAIDRKILNIDIKYFNEISKTFDRNVIYFSTIESNIDIAKTIIDYMCADEEGKNIIINENS